MGGFHIKSLSLQCVPSPRSANTSSVLLLLVVLDALAQLFFLIKSFHADDTTSLFRFTRETSIHRNPPPPSNRRFQEAIVDRERAHWHEMKQWRRILWRLCIIIHDLPLHSCVQRRALTAIEAVIDLRTSPLWDMRIHETHVITANRNIASQFKNWARGYYMDWIEIAAYNARRVSEVRQYFKLIAFSAWKSWITCIWK